MTAPVWLLDVDGVVNARLPGWPGDPATGKAYAGSAGYVMTWAPALVDRIRELHAAGVVEVRWCTTWCAYADELERLWDLPVLGRAFTEDVNGFAAVKAKMRAARQVISEGRRLIWTDDDVVPLPNDGGLHDDLTADGRALLIRPSGRCGLEPEHLDEIEAFAKAAVPVDQHSAPELTDRQLLVEVHRWARANGWNWHECWGWVNARYASEATLAVGWDEGTVTVRSGVVLLRPTTYPVDSVTQAVDMLVTVGVLPAHLSSAYRAAVARP
ncbi:hypothetical protein ACWD6N_03675 [Micromonospora sp. NPDC005163]